MGSIIAVLIPSFVIVFLFSMFALKESPFSQMRLPLSVCTAFLSVLGLLTAFSDQIPSSGGLNTFVGFILIHYIALALAFLTILAVLLLSKIKRWWHRLTSWGTDRTRCEKRRYEPKRLKDYPRE